MLTGTSEFAILILRLISMWLYSSQDFTAARIPLVYPGAYLFSSIHDTWSSSVFSAFIGSLLPIFASSCGVIPTLSQNRFSRLSLTVHVSMLDLRRLSCHRLTSGSLSSRVGGSFAILFQLYGTESVLRRGLRFAPTPAANEVLLDLSIGEPGLPA